MSHSIDKIKSGNFDDSYTAYNFDPMKKLKKENAQAQSAAFVANLMQDALNGANGTMNPPAGNSIFTDAANA